MDMCVLIANGKRSALLWRGVFLFFCLVLNLTVSAADRGINVQGRVTTNNVAFTGTGKFKFALIDGLNGPALWTHDGTKAGVAHEPTGFINLPVTRGIFSTILGDRSIPGMTQAFDPAIFASTDIRVRIWFDDGVNNFQLLTPDQKLSASSYAFNADRAREATAFMGSITISQVPSIVVTNGATNVNFTGAFTGDGSGLVGIRGSTPFQVVSGTDVDMVPNTGYLVTNTVETTLLLPTNTVARVGDIVRVSGVNAGSWKIAQSANQSIVSGGFPRGIGAIWALRETTNRTWTDINSSADGRVLVATVSSAPTAGNHPLYVSTNFGVNYYVPWPTTTPVGNWRTVAGSGDGLRWLAGRDNGTLFVSSDYAQVWENRGPSANWTGTAVSENGSNMVAVAANLVIYISTNAGSSFVTRGTARNYSCVAASADGKTIYAGTTGDRIYASRDGGSTWNALPPANAAWTSIACSADGQRLIAVANNANIITSSQWGTNWVTRPGPSSRAWTAVSSSADGLKLAAAWTGGLLISIDGGENWTQRGPNGNVRSVASSADGRKLSIVYSGGPIWQSVDEMVKSTTPGVNGYLHGDEFSAIELQYIGNGKYFPLSSSGTIYAY